MFRNVNCSTLPICEYPLVLNIPHKRSAEDREEQEGMNIWRSKQELNPYLRYRKPPFYPLDYWSKSHNSDIIHYRFRACQCFIRIRGNLYRQLPLFSSDTILLSLSILSKPMISVTVLSCLTDDGLKSMYGMAPVALIVTRAP